jgi:hypothetical protein
MVAKFKSKTYLLHTFFDFWRRFKRVWLQSLKKVQTLPFFLIKKGLKNVEYHADFKSVEKVLKKCTKKI